MLNVKAIAIANSSVSIQQTFNGMLEGLTSESIKIASYYSSLSAKGKEFFNSCISELEVMFLQQDSKVITERAKTRKLRKQVSCIAKRTKTKKSFIRYAGGLFKTSLYEVLEFRAKQLLQRVGITPTETPILELMSIPVTDAGFIFNTVSLSSEVKCLLNLAAQVLAA